MGVRANVADIVMLSVIGEIASPRASDSPYTIAHDGRALVLTRSGGITYNVRAGDRVIGWAADHTEPGVAGSAMAGHGPGVNTLLVGPASHLRPQLAPQGANLADLLGLRQ